MQPDLSSSAGTSQGLCDSCLCIWKSLSHPWISLGNNLKKEKSEFKPPCTMLNTEGDFFFKVRHSPGHWRNFFYTWRWEVISKPRYKRDWKLPKFIFSKPYLTSCAFYKFWDFIGLSFSIPESDLSLVFQWGDIKLHVVVTPLKFFTHMVTRMFCSL